MINYKDFDCRAMQRKYEYKKRKFSGKLCEGFFKVNTVSKYMKIHKKIHTRDSEPEFEVLKLTTDEYDVDIDEEYIEST
jgi:hypothetical protein